MGYYCLEISLVVLVLVSLTTGQQYQQARQFQINAQEPRTFQKDSSPQANTMHQQYQARQVAQPAAQSSSQSASYEYSDEEEENVPQALYQRPVIQQKQQYHTQHHQQNQHQQQQPQQNKKQLSKKQQQQLEEELEEQEEPDRLAVLLEESKFACTDRNTGYYADDTVGCQVFHYCQENQKHSWVCPEGFTFHQVHLICMPPSNENICEQSSKYTFVNDYLYKPINMEEHQSKPNVTLRYHERYYPESIYTDDRHDHEDERAQIRNQPKQVHRNQPTQAAHIRQQHQQQATQNVYRSPEEINISLQQRRPYFAATTPRFEEEEEYSYEK